MFGFPAEDGFYGRIAEADDPFQIDKQDSVGRVFPDRSVAQLALSQGYFGQSAGGTDGGFTQFALDGGHQAAGGSLSHEVVSPRLHGFDSYAFFDTARHDNEGHVLAGLFVENQGLGGAEPGHEVVAQNEVPVADLQFLRKGLAAGHPLGFYPPATLTQVVDQDERVKLRVLNDEGSE